MLATLGGGLELQDTPAALLAAIELPNTQEGRDVGVLIRRGALRGLSVEFMALREAMRGRTRIVKAAELKGIAIVDRPAYPSAVVSIRQEIRQDGQGLSGTFNYNRDQVIGDRGAVRKRRVSPGDVASCGPGHPLRSLAIPRRGCPGASTPSKAPRALDHALHSGPYNSVRGPGCSWGWGSREARPWLFPCAALAAEPLQLLPIAPELRYLFLVALEYLHDLLVQGKEQPFSPFQSSQAFLGCHNEPLAKVSPHVTGQLPRGRCGG